MNFKRLTNFFKNKTSWRWISLGVLSIATLGFIFALSVITYCYLQGPPSLSNEQNTIFYSQDGQVIGEQHGIESRYWIDLDNISPYVIQATLLTEDRNFYDHHGFDFKRILAASLKNIKAMAKVQGASTITQQYAKNLYLSQEKTWTRKVKEALYALRLEMFYDKDKILEGYLNTIYYGHGAYGIEAASRYYFNKHANELSVAEAAILTGVPKGPTYYSPLSHFNNAKKRQLMILSEMKDANVLTEKQFEHAKEEHLLFAKASDKNQQRIAPYYQDLVLQELKRKLNLNDDQIHTGGYQVYTTLDINKQKMLEKEIDHTVDPKSEIQVAAVSMNPNNGAILSLVGGRNYQKSQYNRAVQARRMPGSTFKPFLYYAAIEHDYTPVTTLMSQPTYFQLSDGQVYAPSNYNGYYANAPITLAQALALSDNVYAVKTNMFLGPDMLVDTARKFGIKSDLPSVPSLALGTASVSVEEMATGYSRLASGGKDIKPYVIKKVTDARGHVIYQHKNGNEKQVLNPDDTFVLTHLMTGMFDESLDDYMRVTGASIASKLTRQYAGKSGTTKTDSWMIGFSPQIATAVWTGYDDNREMIKVDEHKYAKDIWAGYMEDAHENLPFKTFQPTKNVVAVYVDPDSGQLATPYCDNQRLTYFIKGTEPTDYCTVHIPSKEKKEDKKKQPDPFDQPDKKKESGWDKFMKWLF